MSIMFQYVRWQMSAIYVMEWWFVDQIGFFALQLASPFKRESQLQEFGVANRQPLHYQQIIYSFIMPGNSLWPFWRYPVKGWPFNHRESSERSQPESPADVGP